jgi:hypothetical protein
VRRYEYGFTELTNDTFAWACHDAIQRDDAILIVCDGQPLLTIFPYHRNSSHHRVRRASDKRKSIPAPRLDGTAIERKEGSMD